MIRLTGGYRRAAAIGEPRPERRARGESRAAGIARMREDLPRIRQQLAGHGAKPAWFAERYGCWPVDAMTLLVELGARKGRMGEYRIDQQHFNQPLTTKEAP